MTRIEGNEEKEEGIFNALVVTFTCGSSMKFQNDDDDDHHQQQ